MILTTVALWCGLGVSAAAEPVVTVHGTLTWPQALETVLAQDPEAACCATLDDAPARPLDCTGLTDDLMPALAEAFGLQAVQLYGVWLVARAPEPVDAADVWAATLPDEQRAAASWAKRRYYTATDLGGGAAAGVLPSDDAFRKRMLGLWDQARGGLGVAAPGSGLVPALLALGDAAVVQNYVRDSATADEYRWLHQLDWVTWGGLRGVADAQGRLGLSWTAQSADGKEVCGALGVTLAGDRRTRREEQLRRWQAAPNTNRYGYTPPAWNQRVNLDEPRSLAAAGEELRRQTGVEFRLRAGTARLAVRTKLADLPLWSLLDLVGIVAGDPITRWRDSWRYDWPGSTPERWHRLSSALPLAARATLAPLTRGGITSFVFAAVAWPNLSATHRRSLAAGNALNRVDLGPGEARAVSMAAAYGWLASAVTCDRKASGDGVDSSFVTWAYCGDAVCVAVPTEPDMASYCLLRPGSPADRAALGAVTLAQARSASHQWSVAVVRGTVTPRGRPAPQPAARPGVVGAPGEKP